MNIKSLKKLVGHKNVVERGYHFHRIIKGIFKIDGVELTTPVLEYRKDRFVGSVDVGYYYEYYNRFGFINGKIR